MTSVAAPMPARVTCRPGVRSAAPPWLDRTLPAYTWTVIALTAVLALVIMAGDPVPVALQSVIMLALVAVIGLPHGSFDMHVGRDLLRARLGALWGPSFCAAYLAVGAIALAAWLLAPWAGLATLLLLGAVHWGADDLEGPDRAGITRAWLAVSRGLVPVGVPLAAHPAATAEIFAALTSSSSSPGLVQAAGFGALVLAVPGLVVHAIRLARSGREPLLRSCAEVGVLVAWFAVAPPLLAFTVYFCLWHAVRHSLRSAARLVPATRTTAIGRYLRAVAGPTVATWAIAAVALWLMRDGEVATHAVWRVVFIGLFVLTVPHVLLEVMADRVTARTNGVTP